MRYIMAKLVSVLINKSIIHNSSKILKEAVVSMT